MEVDLGGRLTTVRLKYLTVLDCKDERHRAFVATTGNAKATGALWVGPLLDPSLAPILTEHLRIIAVNFMSLTAPTIIALAAVGRY